MATPLRSSAPIHAAIDNDELLDEAEAAAAMERAQREAAAASVESVFRFFLRVPFFRAVDRDALRELAAVATTYTLARGELVLQQGAPPADGVFFVRSGEVRVLQEQPVFARASKARKLKLPRLTQAGLEAQARRQPPSHQFDAPSHQSSHASIISTTTFLTNEAHRSAAQRLRESASMASIHEHDTSTSDGFTRDASTDSLHGYRDLASFDHESARISVPPLPPPPLPADATRLVGSRFLEVCILGPYSTFGELGALLRRPRTASVVSLSAGGQVIAISQADLLQLLPPSALDAARLAAQQAYPSNGELRFELEDTRAWDAYKRLLLDRARDKTTPLKLRSMAAFESVPVRPFALRLPLLPSLPPLPLTTSSSTSSSSPNPMSATDRPRQGRGQAAVRVSRVIETARARALDLHGTDGGGLVTRGIRRTTHTPALALTNRSKQARDR